jgi:hypothetical protein
MTSMTRQRFAVMLLGAMATTGVLVACTLTQSLDYLQSGGEGDGGGADVVSENTTPIDGGGEGGPAKPAEVLVPNQTKPDLLAQDATSLYWVAAGTSVMSVPKAGGTPKNHGTVAGAVYLAVDPDPQGAIFVAAGTDVWSIPKAGGDAGVVYKAAAGQPLIGTVKADETSLFVLQTDPNAEFSEIRRMAKDGTARVDIDDGGSGGAATIMTIDSQTLFWLDSSQTPTTIYELAKNAPAGTKPNDFPFLVDENFPAETKEFAVDSTDTYWVTTDVDTSAPLVISQKRQKGAPKVNVYKGGVTEFRYGAIALDDTNVFVIELKTGVVLRIPKVGGASTVVVDGLDTPSSIVVDATHVYVTAEGTGSMGAVLKHTK